MEDLLIRYLTGSCNEEDIQMVNSWLSLNSENQRNFDQLKDIYYLGKTMKTPGGFDPDKSLARIKSQYYRIRYNELKDTEGTNKAKNLRYLTIVAVAASLLLLISLGINLKTAFRPAVTIPSDIPLAYNEINTPKGSRTRLTLPDGTQVWLNAGSSIRYPMDFFRGDRKVTLTGEAFFDVKKSSRKRFIVNTSDIAIEVWGTKFNVKAYPDESIIRTTLVEGSISIKKLKGSVRDKETYLIPNQTAIYYKDENTIAEQDKQAEVPESRKVVHTVQIQNEIKTVLYTSWKDDKWIIEGESLGSLARELERRYNVSISFDNESIKKYRFNGILADETFEQVLEIIKVSAPINYTIKSNQVRLEEDLRSRSKYDQFLNR